MAASAILKPNHKPIKDYHAQLREFEGQQVDFEMGLRAAFQNLLAETARKRRWTLIPEQPVRVNNHSVRPDGTVRDQFQMPRGYWEAKDTKDNLDQEIQKKIDKGYPLSNIIFEDTQTGVLFQNKKEIYRATLAKPQDVANLLNDFYEYSEPEIQSFEKAVDEFKERVPELAKAVVGIIKDAHKNNYKFQTAYAEFFAVCRSALNPNISQDAVDEMLVQHLLTIRLFRKIFENNDFNRRNAIANEIENVIDALTSQSFSRNEFLQPLDRFYNAIEAAGKNLTDFADKQHFLNTVYERFFQGYSVKTADTHGIVYTPQPIVDFMVNSVEEVLQKEFGLHLWSEGVNILDPCTGTGNFIVNIINKIPKKDLPRVYKNQLFANEVMLLPYYIAALNIEHAYYEKTGQYEPFEGLCFVDTLDMAEHDQADFEFLTLKNTERVERQKNTNITVIIGNPPYNAAQQDENDKNKNRSYAVIDKRVNETFINASSATLRAQYYDPYVKFLRWAIDRIDGREGLVCFVTNNSWVRKPSLDGIRKHVSDETSQVRHFDLRGDARTTGDRRRKEAGNIFSDLIRCGVGISALTINSKLKSPQIQYHSVGDYLSAQEKAQYLASYLGIDSVPWTELHPDDRNNWFVGDENSDFQLHTAMGSAEAKVAKDPNAQGVVFRVYSNGVKTNSDAYDFDFSRPELRSRALSMVEEFNTQLDKWKRDGSPENVEDAIDIRVSVLKWIRNTKRTLRRGQYLTFDETNIRSALYRPYCRKQYYFERAFNEDLYRFPQIFPSDAAEAENVVICTTHDEQILFSALVSRRIPCLHVGGRQGQTFPFYVYDEDGTNRRENITDWALDQFRAHYAKPAKKSSAKSASSADKKKEITKWDIFHYVYGLLHHPGYREKYGDCLKRELPRIPYAPDFWAFADAGAALAHWHLDYEDIDPYELDFIEKEGKPLSYRVEKMKVLGPDGKSARKVDSSEGYADTDRFAVVVNDTLTLDGIPPQVFDYRLGNRAALEWVIDQYRVKTDKRSGITHDPNNPEDPEYIVRLIGQVVKVSLETVGIVDALPDHFGG